MRQDCFGELNEIRSDPFNHPMFGMTINTDQPNDMPKKPSVEYTSRFNEKVHSSQERGRGRRALKKGETVGGEMYPHHHPSEEESEKFEDNSDLNEFYGRNYRWKKDKKRSRSKEILPSQRSLERMKQIERVYLQRIDVPRKHK